MQLKSVRHVIMSVAIVLVVLPAWALGVEKTCEFCHEGHGPKLKHDDINALCSGCHAARMAKGEHRVGMSPALPVRGLPLYNGQMTCATCHDPHIKTALMLRKNPLELCLSCHDK